MNIGSLTWYTLHEIEITRNEILARLRAAGLDEKFAPRPILPSDAFRRATSEVETRRLPLDDGTFVNLLVREVHHDQNEIHRRLVRETVDSGNRRLKYDEIAEIRLDKQTATCETLATRFLSDEENQALHEARRRYERYCDAYQSRHLRIMTLDVLRSMNPVAVRPSGGVYFIPGEHEQTLAKLQTFVRSLHPESNLWTMPVLDSADSRAVIRTSLATEVESAAKQLIEYLSETLKRKGEVSMADQRHALSELQRLQTLTRQYQDVLHDKLLEAEANIEVAQRQMRSLLAAA